MQSIVTTLLLLDILCSSYAFTSSSSTNFRTTTQLFVSSSTHLRRAFVTKSLGILTTSLIFPQRSNSEQGYSSAYLAEPTKEFKASEAERATYKQTQLAIKKDFVLVLQTLVDPNTKTEDQVFSVLSDLIKLTIRTGGLPDGVKKEDLVKVSEQSERAFGSYITK